MMPRQVIPGTWWCSEFVTQVTDNILHRLSFFFIPTLIRKQKAIQEQIRPSNKTYIRTDWIQREKKALS